MLCQLCSGLDLAAIMRLRLETNFSAMQASREDFPPEQVLDWSSFEENENIFHFLLSESYRASYNVEDFSVPYHETLEDLYQASKECDLCRVLLQSAAGIIKIREGIKDSPYWQRPSGEGLFLCGLGNSQGIQLMALDHWYTSPTYGLLGGVGFSIDNGSVFESSIYGRTITISPRSKVSLGFIERWLSACSAQHGHDIACAMKPTRLLRYDQEEAKVSLCTSFPSDIKYAALSHCWGSMQPLTLNAGTKCQLEGGLSPGAFPKTFQDAFWVIQQLKISYIWIDSLCIVQDDQDDWVHESAHMCDVYSNSYLTIAATRASNCSEGFLGPRDVPQYTYIPFNQDGEHGNVAIFPMPLIRMRPWRENIDLAEEPLSKRGWALQERYLPPRTLHFSSTQIYFECGSEFHAEDGHLEHKDSEPDFKIHKAAASEDNNPEDAWNVIVRRYTERYLTVESDKLPAIGGLAERVFLERDLDGSPGDEYLAGLWRKALLEDLAWRTFHRDAKRSTPISYTAPSWSWASVNQPVAFSGHRNTQDLAIVKGAKVDLESSENPFGKVTGGWVHLSGIKLHPCDVEENGRLYFREGDSRFRVSTYMDPPRFNLPEVRLVDYMDKKSDIVAVPLSLQLELVDPAHEDDDPVPGAHFLILISSTYGQGPIDGLACFRRVGLGRSWKEERDGNNTDARRRLRDRCMDAIKTGDSEDIIIV